MKKEKCVVGEEKGKREVNKRKMRNRDQLIVPQESKWDQVVS